MIRNESGQGIAEFSLATLFITLPLIFGGASWFNWEFNKASCAYQSFARARAQLIETGEVAEFPVQIGSMSEDVKLLPLEALDQSGGGLGIGDLGNEVSRLSADSSHFYQRLRELGSTTSLQESTTSPVPKSPSTDALDNSPST